MNKKDSRSTRRPLTADNDLPDVELDDETEEVTQPAGRMLPLLPWIGRRGQGSMMASWDSR